MVLCVGWFYRRNSPASPLEGANISLRIHHFRCQGDHEDSNRPMTIRSHLEAVRHRGEGKRTGMGPGLPLCLLGRQGRDFDSHPLGAWLLGPIDIAPNLVSTRILSQKPLYPFEENTNPHQGSSLPKEAEDQKKPEGRQDQREEKDCFDQSHDAKGQDQRDGQPESCSNQPKNHPNRLEEHPP